MYIIVNVAIRLFYKVAKLVTNYSAIPRRIVMECSLQPRNLRIIELPLMVIQYSNAQGNVERCFQDAAP